MMKSTLINAMKGFVLGSTLTTGITLLTFTGTGDLESIKSLFDTYNQDVETDMSEVVSHYSVTVENANAEIKDYQVALEQANNNITDLIRAYEGKVTELTNANTKYEEDLADLQEELDSMKQSVDQQYKATVETLNGEIKKANEQVAETNEYINNKIVESDTYKKSGNDRIAETKKVLDTTGEPQAKDIPSNIEIPTQKPTEQQGE